MSHPRQTILDLPNTAQNQRGKLARPNQLTQKIIVSAVLGSLSYLVTEQLLGGGPSAIIWAVFIAGVALVSQFLIDMERKLGRFEDSIRSNFERVSVLTEVFGKIDKSAMSTHAAARTLNGMAAVTEDLPPLAIKLLESELERATRSLHAIGNGSDLVYDGEDRDWLMALARNARKIQAISLTEADVRTSTPLTDTGLWNTDLGQRYLNLQHMLINKGGVKIQRVFVVTDSAILQDASFRQTYQIHVDMGAAVRLLPIDKLSLWSRNALDDFILFDDQLLYEVTRLSGLRSTDMPQYQTRITLDESRVERKRELFAEIWNAGNEPD